MRRNFVFIASILAIFTSFFIACKEPNPGFYPDFVAIKDFSKYKAIGVGESRRVSNSRAVISSFAIPDSELVGQLDDDTFEVVTFSDSEGNDSTVNYNVGYFENHGTIALFGIHEVDESNNTVSLSIDQGMDSYNYILNKATGKVYSIDDYSKVKSVTEVEDGFVFSAVKKAASRSIMPGSQDIYNAYFNEEDILVIETLFTSEGFPLDISNTYFYKDKYNNIVTPFFYVKNGTNDIVSFHEELDLRYGFNDLVYKNLGFDMELNRCRWAVFTEDCVFEPTDFNPESFVDSDNLDSRYSIMHNLIHSYENYSLYVLTTPSSSDSLYGVTFLDNDEYSYLYLPGIYPDEEETKGAIRGTMLYTFANNAIMICDYPAYCKDEGLRNEGFFYYELKKLNYTKVDQEGNVLFKGVLKNLDSVEGFIDVDWNIHLDITEYVPPEPTVEYVYPIE